MELINFTKDENQTTVEELYCSVEFTREVHGELIFLSALNVFLSIAAIFENALMLIALHKETSLHPPSKLLHRNLAITDLCVGIIAEPVGVVYWTSVVNERWDICYYVYLARDISNYTLCSVSFLTLTAVSVDRLLALLLGLRYRQVVTLRRACISVIVFWVLSSVVFGLSLLSFETRLLSWIVRVGYALGGVTTIFCYTKMFFTLRHNQIHVQSNVSQGQPNHAIPLNTARYRKAVYSALWVQVTLVVCYLPFFITAALPLSTYLARQITLTLVYLNSSVNLLLYCWKIREVRQAVKETVKQLFCLSS